MGIPLHISEKNMSSDGVSGSFLLKVIITNQVRFRLVCRRYCLTLGAFFLMKNASSIQHCTENVELVHEGMETARLKQDETEQEGKLPGDNLSTTKARP